MKTFPQNAGPIAALVTLIVLLFGSHACLYSRQGAFRGDFESHLQCAKDIIRHGAVVAPEIPTHISAHPFYHLLAIGMARLPGLSLRAAGYCAVPVLSHLVLGLLVYKVLLTCSGGSRKKHLVLYTLGLMLVGPVSLLTYPDLYLGYIGMAVYHSPTQIVSRPLALLVFTLLTAAMGRPRPSGSLLLSLLLASAFSLLAKPSYVICIIPAVLVYALVKRWRGHYVNLTTLLLFLGVNGGVLLWQLGLAYGVNKPDDAIIIIAPLAVMRTYGGAMGFRLAASVLFPALVYLLFYRRARTDDRLNLAWLVFGVSLLYTYVFAESGSRLDSGNFVWGSQLALLVLFVASVMFLLERRQVGAAADGASGAGPWRRRVCAMAFVLHLASGVIYFAKTMAGGWYV